MKYFGSGHTGSSPTEPRVKDFRLPPEAVKLYVIPSEFSLVSFGTSRSFSIREVGVMQVSFKSPKVFVGTSTNT